MPDGIETLEFSQRVALQAADADLYALLANEAPAELELAAMNGSLAAVAPSPQELQAEQNKAEVEQLIADGAFPTQGYYENDAFVPGRSGNLTAQLRIAQLDPQRYEAEMLKATPPATQQGLSQEQANWVTGEMLRNRYAAQQPTPAGAA